MAGGQCQTAGDFAGQVGQGAAGVIQYIEDLIGPWQQGAAGFGQADFPAQSIEQSHLQLLLQPGDALADGRLRQVQPFAGAGEASGLGNRDKSVEVGEVHNEVSVTFQLVMQSIKNMNLSYLM